MPDHQTDRVAIVTGATSGIGAAIARRFVESGVAVIATGRRLDRLRELEDWSKDRRIPMMGVQSDATEPGFIAKLFEAAERAWGLHPNIVVLSAGQGLPGTVMTSDEARWEGLIGVNLLGPLRQLRDSAEKLAAPPGYGRAVGGADIVVIGSTVGRHVSAMNPVYGATKFALHSLTEALRQEVCGRGVRVTLLEPGFVKTEFQATAGYDLERFAALEDDQGPFLSPDDVARAVSFVVAQPPGVHFDDIRIRPTRQKA